MSSLVDHTVLFVKRNASTILTVLGGVGLVGTVALSVKATSKAVKQLEEATEEKGEELTKLEVVKTVGVTYIPTIATGAATLACIFGANILNQHQQAALMSAYALVDNSYKEYKAKVKELYGEETHQNIVNAIAIEKADPDTFVNSNYLGTRCDLSLEESDGEPKLFYDEHSSRYFEATIERVLTAEYHLNRNYVLRGHAWLNEFYEFLGIEETDYGSVMGWAATDEGEYWIEFSHHKITMDDGMEVYLIEMPFEPRYDFLDW